MNVLSLFDGKSGAMSALESLGIKPTNYYASEVNKFAEAVSRFHYPEIIRLGDVKNVSFFGLPKIDLLVAGFPCQAFSIAGNQRGIADPRGALIFEMVRVIEEVKPKYFLLENVPNFKKIDGGKIYSWLIEKLEACGYATYTHIINSALVSAQNRNRLYITNIPGIKQPKDRKIYLKDVINDGYVDRDKSYAVTTKVSNGASLHQYLNHRTHQVVFKVANVHPSGIGQNGNVYDVAGKSPALTTNKGEGIKICGAAVRGRENSRNIELNSSGKANSITTFREASMVAIQQRGRGFNKGGTYTDKSPTMSSHGWQDNNHLCLRVGTAGDLSGHDYNKRIYSQAGKNACLNNASGGNLEPKIAVDEWLYRKLIPTECERLQTYPDDYTKYGIDSKGRLFEVSPNQRFIMLGNGFTREVIAHLLSNIPEIRKMLRLRKKIVTKPVDVLKLAA